MRKLSVLICAFATVLGVVSGANTASANVSTGAGPYCVLSVTTQMEACFRSESELLTYRASSAEIDLVAVYNWIKYSQDPRAGYNIIVGPNNCTAAYDEEFEVRDLSLYIYRLSGLSMNNSISSVSTYVNPKCDVKFFDGANFTGDSSVWIDRCTHLGTCTAENWYDRAGSLKIS